MTNPESPRTDAADLPRRIRDCDVAERYGISRRLGGEWIRAMVAEGVLVKRRRVSIGRWARVDRWVEQGSARRGRRMAP